MSLISRTNQATGYASQHNLVPVPSQDKKIGRVAIERAFGIKMGEMIEVGHRQSRWGDG